MPKITRGMGGMGVDKNEAMEARGTTSKRWKVAAQTQISTIQVHKIGFENEYEHRDSPTSRNTTQLYIWSEIVACDL